MFNRKTEVTEVTSTPIEFTDSDNNVQNIQIGDKVRDVITGAEGIVVSYSKHLTGCDTITIELGVNSDGRTPLLAIDVTRAGIVEAGLMSKEKLPGFQGVYKDVFAGKALPASG